MSSSQLPAPISQADYETIASAVMETERGRWFLDEYARRNRHADTERVLAAIARLQDSFGSPKTDQRLAGMRSGLAEMAKAIAVTHTEIHKIRPDGLNASRLYQATGELDAVVQATELATSSILSATEQLQEHAWSLREQGVSEAQCDSMDACATEIYAACGFQDITAQRTRKVIDVLNFVEGRIKAMMTAWEIDTPASAETATPPKAEIHVWPPDADQQYAIDRTFASVAPGAPAQPAATIVHQTVPPPPVQPAASPQRTPEASQAFAEIDALPVEERLRRHT